MAPTVPTAQLMVAGAFSADSRSLRKRLKITDEIHSTPLHYYQGLHEASGRRVDVLVTGLGEQNIRHAIGILRKSLASLNAVVLVGAAAALDPALTPADLVVADRVFNHHGDKYIINPSHVDLLRSTRPENIPARVGPLVSVDRPAITVLGKQELHQQFHALSVDTESYLWAEMCHGLNLRLGVLRGVAATACETLPMDGADHDVAALSRETVLSRMELVADRCADWLEALLGVV